MGRVRNEMNTIIREMRPEEYSLLREFLYQAIYLPAGVDPPPRSVVDLPELQIYIADFGTRPGDRCIVAEAAGKVVGATWCRIMADYGHIDNDTPSLAISLLPEYRGQGLARELVYRYSRREKANGRKKLFLTCLEQKVEMYKKFGLQDLGIADSTWGGEEWHEMVLKG